VDWFYEMLRVEAAKLFSMPTFTAAHLNRRLKIFGAPASQPHWVKPAANASVVRLRALRHKALIKSPDAIQLDKTVLLS